jgi:NCAIR mutase (PurE)-related protein
MFSEDRIRSLLDQVARGALPVDAAVSALKRLPFEQIDGASLDHHRRLRDGFGEVVYCDGKTPDQVARIFAALAAAGDRILGTRATPEQFEAAGRTVSDIQYHTAARALWLDRKPAANPMPGIVVVCAGTSDLAVTEEAALTIELMGHAPVRITDVGVAGLHRLLHHLDVLQSANVIVAAAGMEGALPGVIAGLVGAPVIAVPTSVGYGAALQGWTALLGMLSSCAAGVAVVNIDNGFGAGYLAATINRKIHQGQGNAP